MPRRPEPGPCPRAPRRGPRRAPRPRERPAGDKRRAEAPTRKRARRARLRTRRATSLATIPKPYAAAFPSVCVNGRLNIGECGGNPGPGRGHGRTACTAWSREGLPSRRSSSSGIRTRTPLRSWGIPTGNPSAAGGTITGSTGRFVRASPPASPGSPRRCGGRPSTIISATARAWRAPFGPWDTRRARNAWSSG